MTIEEIQTACAAGKPLDFSRNPFEAPELPLRKTFHPLGFPAEFSTNSACVLNMLAEMWGAFHKSFDTPKIDIAVHVLSGDSTACPPAPHTRIVLPFVSAIADHENFSIADLERTGTHIVLSAAALSHPLYPKHFFLNASPLTHIATRFAAPIHAGCVALEGRAVLLCGDSGAGKSSLSYACARAGWTYISDDASFVLNDQPHPIAAGNCHQIRFRPTAAELFPEIGGIPMTPRAAGKPSIEISSASIPGIHAVQNTGVDFIVFLNRRTQSPPGLQPYCKTVARHFMRQTLFGPAESRAVQYRTIEQLLTLPVLELRYTHLDWAVDRLASLLRNGL